MSIHSSFRPERLWQHLREQQPKRWLLGFSGGLDSSVLLDALLRSKPPQPVIAIHINHGLSPQAASWQAHCEEQCRRWGVECRVAKVEVQAAGRGLEDAARQARYQVFAAEMQAGDALLLAHHCNDQAETLLFRLLRGAGPRGLAAMAPRRPFGPGHLLRPLLNVQRSELQHYAEAHGLLWIEDASNASEDFDRNFLRQRVMPLLEQRWPGFARRWTRSAAACREADQLSRDLGRLDLEQAGEHRSRDGWALNREALLRLPDYRRDNALRSWLLEHGFSLFEHKQFFEVERQLFGADPASGATVSWADTALRYYRGQLYLGPPTDDDFAREPISWQPPGEMTLPDGSILRAQPAAQGLRLAPGAKVEVRWRSGGERCRPAEREHSQTLKKLLQEYELEPWLRERAPLIYVGDELAAVADLWICAAHAGSGEGCLSLEWQLPTG